MIIHIFETLTEAREYLKDKKLKNTQVQFHTEVVGKVMDKENRTSYQIVDRFLILED